MFTRPPEKPNPEIELIHDRMTKMEGRIAVVEGYQLECDQLHKKIEEQSKRNDDAMKYNTESNIFLTKSVNDLNITINQTFTELNNSISELANKVKTHDPVIEKLVNVGEAWKINNAILAWVAGLAVAITSIAAAIKYFFY